MPQETPNLRPSPTREWVIIIVFLVLIATPSVGQFAGFSDTGFIKMTELRNPAPRPEWPSEHERWREFPAQVETFINDHFGFRAWLSTLNNTVLAFLGTSGSKKVIIGEDGWLFVRDPRLIGNEGRAKRPITDRKMERWIQATVRRKGWLEAQGAGLITVVVPSTHSIYPEFLPSWARRPPPNRLDLFSRLFAEYPDLGFVDLRTPILEQKARSNALLYRKTDTHWNVLGGFLAYRTIMDKVREDFPAFPVLERADVKLIDIEPENGGDLSRMLNTFRGFREPPYTGIRVNTPLRIQSAELKTDTGWAECSYTDAVTTMMNVSILKTGVEDAPRVLIFRDSFTTELIPFFARSFSEIMLDHHRRNTLDKDLVEAFRPDVVLFIFIESSLVNRPKMRPQEEG